MTPADDGVDAFRRAMANGGVVRHSMSGGPFPADALRDILLDPGGRLRLVILSDAEVTGELDLEAGTVPSAMRFVNCGFDSPPVLEQASVAALTLSGCRLPGLEGSQLRISANLILRRCAFSGGVRLTGAHIDGRLVGDGSRLTRPDGCALSADGMVVGQDVQFDGGFRVDGAVRMVGARIGGQFDCDGARFDHPGGVALHLGGLVVEERTFWRHGFRVRGTAVLSGAKLVGGFDLSGAALSHPRGDALRADRLAVHSDVVFAGAVVEGRADFTGSDVRGVLDLTAGRFLNAGATAIDLSRARVAQNLVCRSGFLAEGRVLMGGAEIGGNLWCEGGRIDNTAGVALDATGLVVRRDVRLGDPRAATDGVRARFNATGPVVFSDASVGGSLDCTGGWFTDRDEALVADRVRIGNSGTFDGMCAEGPVRIRFAKFEGNLSFVDSAICDQERALTLRGSEVRGRLRLKLPADPIGGIDLRFLSVGQLDDRGSGWPERLWLNEFTYKALYDHSNVDARIACLGRNHEFAPQTYAQLARVYESAGKYDDAKHVLIAGQDAGRKAGRGVRRAIARALGFVLKWTVGYGYRPLWVLYWVAALTVVGAIASAVAHPDGFRQAKSGLDVGFEPVLYTLDLLLPVVNLRQRELWVPVGWVLWGSSAFTALGWVLAICLVTGLGKAFKREL
ncbi:hypothetical protein SUDANB95_04498 [Actinosynnema sp. ALI-1.44]